MVLLKWSVEFHAWVVIDSRRLNLLYSATGKRSIGRSLTRALTRVISHQVLMYSIGIEIQMGWKPWFAETKLLGLTWAYFALLRYVAPTASRITPPPAIIGCSLSIAAKKNMHAPAMNRYPLSFFFFFSAMDISISFFNFTPIATLFVRLKSNLNYQKYQFF